MNARSTSLAAGAGYTLLVALYAVLAGIAPTPVTEPTFRIPSLLFAVVVPAVAAFTLAAGGAALWRRYGLRAPAAGLVAGSLVAVVAGPDEGTAFVLLLGGFGWLTVLGAGELLGRIVARRTADESLPADERAALAGVAVGLAYTLVFAVVAIRPAWATATGPSVPGPVEAVLTVAFLLGAYCLLLGVPVALALRHGLVTPLVVSLLWLGNDVLSGWRGYTTYDEWALLVFFLGFPAALTVLVALALVETAVRRLWDRRHRPEPQGTAAQERTE